MFYSKSTGGFYTDEIHGARTISVPDPDWSAPNDDPEAVAPLVNVENPDCIIPTDAVAISDADYDALFSAQSSGKIITADKNGNPVAVDRPAPTAAELAAQKISDAKTALEASDIVAIRCIKAGVAFPAEWQAYCATLRAIVGGSSDAMPAQPTYPAGT